MRARSGRRISLLLALATASLSGLGCRQPWVAVPWEAVADPCVVRYDLAAPHLALTDNVGSIILGEGWSRPEADGLNPVVWAAALEVGFEFLAPPDGAVDLVARCRPFHFPDAPRQFAEIEINSRAAGRFEISPGWRDVRFQIPEESLVPGANQLILRFAYATSPADVGDSPDVRTLAVAFKQLGFVPRGWHAADPAALTARLDPEDARLRLPPGAGVEIPVGVGLRVRLELAEVEAEDSGAQLAVEVVDPEGAVRQIWSGRAGQSANRTFELEAAAAGISALRMRNTSAGHGVDSAVSIAFALGSMRLGPGSTHVGSPARPHVFIYLVDALRADALELFGGERPTSPRLAEFAGDAVVYDRAFAASSWTLPSIVSLLTGKHVAQHGVGVSKYRFDPDSMATLPRVLAAEGYDTVAVSHSHVAGPDFAADLGFDRLFSSDFIVNRVPKSHEVRRALTQWLVGRGTDVAPVFCYVHTVAPHGPYSPQKGFRKYADLFPSDLDVDSLWPYRFQIEWRRGTEEELHHLRGLYDGEAEYADDQFGRFLSMLKLFGLYENSLIVFLSDHGEEFAEHRGFGHGRTLYHELVHVPMVVKYPGNRHAGTRVAGRVSLVDLVTTVGQVVGVDCSALGVGGAAFEPHASDGESSAVPESIIVSESKIGAYGVLPAVHLRSVMIGDLKCIENLLPVNQFGESISRFETYDLAQDPSEMKPLPETDPRSRECHAVLDRMASEAKSGDLASSGPDQPDERVRDALRALGYVD